MQRLLEPIEFRNLNRVRGDLTRLGQGLPAEALDSIRILLSFVPDPDRAQRFLERFREEEPRAFERALAFPAELHYLITTFSYSKFLSEALLRHQEWISEVASSGELEKLASAEELEGQLKDVAGPGVPSAVILARFRRRQLLRILLRDVLKLATLSEITEELSNLSDAILEFAYLRIRQELERRHGVPRYESRECGFAVIALGKLGGQELNYSSDIDLMFLYSGNGQTDGADPITNKEFFKKVANQYTELLSAYSPEGSCYRVDLRLRPDGSLGEICISFEGAQKYYRERARDWERQMLIKARAAAGDRKLGGDLLDFVEPLIYSTTLDFQTVEAVSATRERIGEKLAARRGSRAGLDIKLAPGGIRDIEFLAQCLQRLHGGREPWVQHGGTAHALSRLRDKDLLSDSEYSRLASAYEFLRNLEHRLQFDEDRQTHTLPSDPEILDVLARKMPLDAAAGPPSAESLSKELRDHLEEVQELYERVIHAQKPMYYMPAPLPVQFPANEQSARAPVPEPAPVFQTNLIRFLDQIAPELSAGIQRARLRRGRERFEHFLEEVVSRPELLARLNEDPRLLECATDLFEHSVHFGEQLIRDPDLAGELCDTPAKLSEQPVDGVALRRYYRGHMVRIQSQSICRRQPIFTTLEQTSDLADAVIAIAYRLALDQALEASAYQPRARMMTIALGRLGMREFDLASDADLVFVVSDSDAVEHVFWTGVAERMIDLISAYTREGVIFTVDTRLRPNGRAGALVQSESAYKEYFAKQAEAWEGISYMKARGIAGDLDRATEFLHELQNVDWRRYGQNGRSRQELAQMRCRLEKEQATRHPLKAGRGGYYDIDFALMYLRLKGAGIFYKVLNTPQRIDVIEQMGHLDREDAEFLRDAATFYRALDHGLRLSSGQSEGNLPTAQVQIEMLTELVSRWTPERLHDQPLDMKLAQIRDRTREFFDRIFG